MNKNIREQYVANEILRIGDIVEDSKSGQSLKILDRGSNYITVESHDGVVTKRWLTEVTASEPKTVVESDFSVVGEQIKMFGYETRSFDKDLSEFLVEQFSEFEDLYSKHQIIKLLDFGLTESNDIDKRYDYLEKASSFYRTQSIDEPIIIEGVKNELERRRIANIVAGVANIEPDKTPYATVVAAIKVLKDKYHDKKQWEVLWPFFVLVNNYGITGLLSTLPFNFDKKDIKNNPEKHDPTTESVTQLLEDNFEELVESLEIDDILETFSEDEYSEEFLTEEQLDEVISLTTRNRMAIKMKSHEANLEVKRARALTRGASQAVLMSRARRLAETMIKRRMFRKPPADMTRQEKERFEAGASRRKAVVAKLAQRLITRVRSAQTARLHAHAGGQVSNQGAMNHTTYGAV